MQIQITIFFFFLIKGKKIPVHPFASYAHPAPYAVVTRYNDLFINYRYQVTFPLHSVPLPPELNSLSCLRLFHQWQHDYLSLILAHTQGQKHCLEAHVIDLNRTLHPKVYIRSVFFR